MKMTLGENGWPRNENGKSRENLRRGEMKWRLAKINQEKQQKQRPRRIWRNHHGERLSGENSNSKHQYGDNGAAKYWRKYQRRQSHGMAKIIGAAGNRWQRRRM